MNECLCVPNTELCIRPGCRIRLGKFESACWCVNYGWYTWGGNRPVCGWYLTSCKSNEIKPLQLTDLDDIYIIE